MHICIYIYIHIYTVQVSVWKAQIESCLLMHAFCFNRYNSINQVYRALCELFALATLNTTSIS